MKIPNLTIQQLLEAGVHLGHKTLRWNPKMKRYIFGKRDSIHIIDLTQTLELTKIRSLNFEKVDKKKFPALDLAFTVLDNGDLFGAVLNAAKEVALEKFIRGEIKFLEITNLVRRVLEANQIQELRDRKLTAYDDVFFADELSREIANNL